MDYFCCEPVDERDSGSEGTITCSTDEGILECDYDTQVTKLYQSIEERQWEDVLYFLETGKWYNTSIFNAFGEQGDSPSVQARTWVTALDETGNVRWCQLPLHAAVTFLAPISVIQKLIEINPKSVRCADDQDMLPLHYAFRFGAEDDILAHLLDKFPQAIGKSAVKNRLPLDLAQYGPRVERGIIIHYYIQSAIRNAKTEWDGEYEKMVSSMKNTADVELRRELHSKKKKLAAAMEELARTKNELQALQNEKAAEKRSYISANQSLRSNKSWKSNKSVKSVKSNSGGKKSNERIVGESEVTENAPRRRPSALHKKGDDSVNLRAGISKLFGKRKTKQ